jgi:quercetin dioxygenase-like cupin family protein
LKVICTPFDEISVDMCVRHDIEILKVASCSADDWPLLEKIAATGKPVIASTGGLGWAEIDNLYYFLKHRDVEFALMHCVALYPTPIDKCNLGVIEKMRKRYDCPIGYSGHENSVLVSPLAVAKGAEIIERHVCIPEIYANAYSLTPDGVVEWVDSCSAAFEACEDQIKSLGEAESLGELSRGVYVIEGEERFCMPRGERPVSQLRLRDATTLSVRDYIHEYEGMFREANIPLVGEKELSHHYGLDNFRATGAFIVSVFNEKYCKKLIALLPGQAHPPHNHKKKTETFQVLYGDLGVTKDGENFCMRAGDFLTVESGEVHSFQSVGGCVFEEISTHHFKNDSYYEDPNVEDPMRRKTVFASD